MQLYVTVKSASRKRGYLTEQAFTLPEQTNTLRKLLLELTRQMVNGYQAKQIDADAVQALTEEQVAEGAAAGRVGFGRRYGQGNTTVEAAQETMLLALEDGLFRVFCNEVELTELDAPLALADGDKLLLFRMILLAGSALPYLPY